MLRHRTAESPKREKRTIPVYKCDIREGRTEKEKQALTQEITQVVHETTGGSSRVHLCLYSGDPQQPITLKRARRSGTTNPRVLLKTNQE
jgi:hypothetical protein